MSCLLVLLILVSLLHNHLWQYDLLPDANAHYRNRPEVQVRQTNYGCVLHIYYVEFIVNLELVTIIFYMSYFIKSLQIEGTLTIRMNHTCLCILVSAKQAGSTELYPRT